MRPSWASSMTRARIHWMPSRSRPLTGSSRIKTAGSASSAAAMPRRWPIPSENEPADLWATSVRPTDASTSSTRRSPMPTVAPRASRWLRALRLLSTPWASSSAPTSASGAGDSMYGRPLTSAAPEVGRASDDHPHCRRLSGPVRTEKAGDDARPDGGADAVDGKLATRRCAEVAVSLGELLQFNHAFPRGCSTLRADEKITRHVHAIYLRPPEQIVAAVADCVDLAGPPGTPRGLHDLTRRSSISTPSCACSSAGLAERTTPIERSTEPSPSGLCPPYSQVRDVKLWS